MGRAPCCSEEGLKKGPWTPEEDKLLVDYIQNHGHGSWRHLPKLAGLNRCGKSCRLRWTNYLRPDIKRGKFEEDEEQLIIHLHSVLGNKWSMIATHLPGRTDNEIKNYWNTHLRKKLLGMGIDPVTHRPRTDLVPLAAGIPNLLAAAAAANLGNLPNLWDSLKLQADAAQLARLQLLQTLTQVLAPPPTTTTTTSTSSATSVDPLSLLSTSSLLQNSQLNDFIQLKNQLLHLNNNIMPSFITTPQQSNNNNSFPHDLTTNTNYSIEQISSQDQVVVDDNKKKINNLRNVESGTVPTPNSTATPSLVSSPDNTASGVDQMQEYFINSNTSDVSVTSNPFDPWEELKLEDFATEVGWKDILEQVSCWSK